MEAEEDFSGEETGTYYYEETGTESYCNSNVEI